MKFALALIGFAAAQEGEATCTVDLDCSPTDDGAKQRCATMTMEGFSVDQCVADILCDETMEIDGVEMNYNCFDKGAKVLMASFATIAAVTFAM